ncbi:MAG TPA: ABC transporter substrate-binding protein [Burkholderiales bacterium]|nr:ABC transporter substrate-binding protein [Burkholderiales bacterium]
MRIRQILFVPPAPIVWAEHRGAFAARGLEVETTQTASSDQMGEGLAAGTWDVGIPVMDNVVAWNAERAAGLRIVAQLERSTIMAFCAKRELESLAQAAAQPIAVDATTNGFVLVLYRALARAGLDWRAGRYDTVGGVRHRFEALAAGRAASTILVPPFIDMALERGFRKLWDGSEIAPHYPGVVVAARERWLRGQAEAARAYVGALCEANAWAIQHPEEAAAALAAARYAPRAAERLAREAVPGLEPSAEGWNEVVALRRECGLLPAPEPRAAEVIDRSFL